MQIERISYRKVGNDTREYKKLVLTKIDENHYFTQAYLKVNGEWTNAQATSHFDGEKVHNGVVHYTSENVDTKFEFMIKYEQYVVVEE